MPSSDSEHESDDPDTVLTIEYKTNCETAHDVFFAVRAEFAAWKEGHAQFRLQRFASELHVGSAAERFQVSVDALDLDPVSPGRPNCLDVVEYDDDGEIVGVGRIDLITIEPEHFISHPPYQFCTPSTRNLNARMIDNYSAPFIPYPEDPSFLRDRYLEYFPGGYQWVADMLDPDEEVLRYETVRRLHVELGLSARAIDEVARNKDFLGRCALRRSNESGLLWDSSQRDFPPVIWADGVISSRKPQLPPHFAQKIPDPNDIFGQINRSLKTFCANLNCLVHGCKVHIDPDWEYFTPPVLRKQSLLTSNEFFAQPGNACGNDCFRWISENDMVDDGWDDVPIGNIAFLQSILQLDPDIFPCDLAVICKMTCRHVFIYRKENIDDVVEDARESPAGENNKKSNTRTSQTINQPLVHVGKQRWKGCNSTCAKNISCSPTGKKRRGKKLKECACRAAMRECDPELCTACNARHLKSDATHPQTTKCTNMDVTRGVSKSVIVKRSRYGLGAFAGEDIKANDLIGEYIGELLDDSEEPLVHRGVIQEHSKLNYCFGTGPGSPTVVDAQWLGNPMRFLNDSKPRKPNCTAYPIIVNGELKVVIRALKCIKMGRELTLSYGPEYWDNHADVKKG
ncbi:hypothetical protein GGX14DRAFT_471445 [Mycena pura]|uniref:SET domain-containing protein n=1 Tax=Mycena pura TaxID=153505 RepID=A0AAD6UX99_9AGAR|nr:hypothetical protein GGX14DRAFT_471445 [Mycena pura]